MTIVRRLRNRGPWLLLSLLSVLVSGAVSAAGKGDLRHFLGTWHGTSTCVNRQVAPACKDETVVYEVRRSEKPQAAIEWGYLDEAASSLGNVLRELVVNAFGGDGVWIHGAAANNNTGVGCYIGTDAVGVSLLGNTGHGIRVQTGSDNVLGGTTPGAGNLIAGNNAIGVAIID